MEEEDLELSIKKTVKKTTFSGIIDAAKYNLKNTSPIKKFGVLRSQSVKKVTVFVPHLKPRKSTFVPTPLKLSQNFNVNTIKKEKEDNKQLSDDEIEIIGNSNSSHSSVSSSDLGNSSKEENSEEIIKTKPIMKNDHAPEKIKTKSILKNNDVPEDKKVYSNKLEETFDSFASGEEKINEEINNTIKTLRRKMSHVKSKAKIKNKETDETLPNNLIKNFDLELKNEDKSNNAIHDYHCSVNLFPTLNPKPKPKSIFEVISHSNKNLI